MKDEEIARVVYEAERAILFTQKKYDMKKWSKASKEDQLARTLSIANVRAGKEASSQLVIGIVKALT
jgi:hypothetical protein